jgi:hypothetical protein
MTFLLVLSVLGNGVIAGAVAMYVLVVRHSRFIPGRAATGSCTDSAAQHTLLERIMHTVEETLADAKALKTLVVDTVVPTLNTLSANLAAVKQELADVRANANTITAEQLDTIDQALDDSQAALETALTQATSGSTPPAPTSGNTDPVTTAPQGD